MREHPIENLMKTAMNSIRDMIDVNTIIGNPIQTEFGMCIIPVSKVCFGFASGGSEFNKNEKDKKDCKEEEPEYPFGGGSGAAVKINPIGFIIIDSANIGAPKFVPIEHTDAIDKLLDYVPDLMEKVNKVIDKIVEKKKDPFIKHKTDIEEVKIENNCEENK